MRQSERKAMNSTRPKHEQMDRCGCCGHGVRKGLSRVICPVSTHLIVHNINHFCTALKDNKRLWVRR